MGSAASNPRIVRSGTVRLTSGVVLSGANEVSCGCIFGTAGEAFVLVACPDPGCEVRTYASEAARGQGKPIGVLGDTSAGAFERLVGKLTATADKKEK